jgi:hypothetical protein
MKNLKTLFALFFISILFITCKKENIEKDNAFTYKGTTFKTPHGFIFSTYKSTGKSLHYIAICSPSINYSKNDGLTGTGELIIFTIISNDNEELLPGTYNSGPNFFPEVYIDYNVGGKEAHFSHPVNSTVNKVIISKPYDKIEISYTLDYGSGNAFEGYFKGNLSPYYPFSK